MEITQTNSNIEDENNFNWENNTFKIVHTMLKNNYIVTKIQQDSYNDFITNDGWTNSKTNGKMRLEGKDYIVKDGDVLNFRFNT